MEIAVRLSLVCHAKSNSAEKGVTDVICADRPPVSESFNDCSICFSQFDWAAQLARESTDSVPCLGLNRARVFLKLISGEGT